MNLNITQGFASETCIDCGVIFWMPDELRNQRLKNRKNFFCPNGHPMAFVESESDRLKKQLAERDRELARAEADVMTYKAGCNNRDISIARLQMRIKRLKKGVVKKDKVKP